MNDYDPRCVTCGGISHTRSSVTGSPGLECQNCHAQSMKALHRQQAEAACQECGASPIASRFNMGEGKWVCVDCYQKCYPSADANDFQRWLTTVPFPQSKRCDYLSLLTMNLGGESGEVIELLKKHIRDDTPIDLPHLTLELGDVMIIVADIASHFKVPMSQILGAAKNKTQGRMDRDSLRGSGNDR